MKVAIHQPNLIPWLPFFYKMAMADKFIILTNVQFEKGGYQNRYKLSDGEWVTKAVQHGKELISDKHYADMQPLLQLNMSWINVIRETLNIKTEIMFDTDFTPDSPTEKLIYEIQNAKGNVYITNPEAKSKYLNEQQMEEAGIGIEYCHVPKHLQVHIFEAFEIWGIDGTIKQLQGIKCKTYNNSLIT